MISEDIVYAVKNILKRTVQQINNIQIVCNMKGVADRVLRTTSANGRAISNVALYQPGGASPYSNAKLFVQYLTPNMSLDLPAKSSVPFLETPRYLTTNTVSGVAQNATFEVQSQTIVLPMIPDSLIIYVKPQTYTTQEADWYYPIEKIVLNFDNFAGLLSSHTQEMLYGMSIHSGLDMDFDGFKGLARVARSGSAVRTTGAPLVIKPGIDFALQAGQAPGLNYSNRPCQSSKKDWLIPDMREVPKANTTILTTKVLRRTGLITHPNGKKVLDETMDNPQTVPNLAIVRVWNMSQRLPRKWMSCLTNNYEFRRYSLLRFTLSEC